MLRSTVSFIKQTGFYQTLFFTALLAAASGCKQSSTQLKAAGLCPRPMRPIGALPTKLPIPGKTLPKQNFFSGFLGGASDPACIYRDYDLSLYSLEADASVEREQVLESFKNSIRSEFITKFEAGLDAHAYEGMDWREALAIWQYTRATFHGINSKLRKHELFAPGEDLALDVLVAASGLSKLPSYQDTVWRFVKLDLAGCGIDPNDLSKVYAMPTFTSSSTSTQVVFDYKGSGTLFKIASQTGRLVEHLSAYPDEHEVLFAPGTEFKILKISTLNGLPLVEMEETNVLNPEARGSWETDAALADSCDKADCKERNAAPGHDVDAEGRSTAASAEASADDALPRTAEPAVKAQSKLTAAKTSAGR